MKVKIMNDFNKLIDLIDQHSIFALERVKTDNPFFDSYKRLLEDNHHPNDIYAIINKHRREFDQFLKYINPEYLEEKLTELSSFAYAIYKKESTKLVNDIFMAITMTELILRHTSPEADPRSCELESDSKLKDYFELNVIGFKYPLENIRKYIKNNIDKDDEENKDHRRAALEMYYALKRMES